MDVKIHNVRKGIEYFARKILEEALDQKRQDENFDCAYYIKEKMNSQDVLDGGWNCVFVESATEFSWAIDPNQSLEIKVKNYTILIFRMVISSSQHMSSHTDQE